MLKGFKYETEARTQGFRFILGIDEAGRGPLAGPVVAAAVCLRDFDFTCPISDSKQMTAKARETAFEQIFQRGYVGIGFVSEVAIDQINILNATFRAMEKAVYQLMKQVHRAHEEILEKQVKLFIDGNMFRSELPYPYQTIIDGDCHCFTIACASIIAKVYRDRLMQNYDRVYPEYGFKNHKGYPTESHRQAIIKHGPCVIHRKSFQGVL